MTKIANEKSTELTPVFIETNEYSVEVPIWSTTTAQGESMRKVMDEIMKSREKRTESRNSIVLEDPLSIDL